MITISVFGLTDEQADKILLAIDRVGSQEIRDQYAWKRERVIGGIELNALNWVTSSAIASVLLDEDSDADYLT